MEINIHELHEICERLFQNINEKGINHINLDVDYYWNIPQQLLYNPYQQPSEMDMGQLSDDWSELRKIARSEKEPLGYHLVWIAAILRAVGENLIL